MKTKVKKSWVFISLAFYQFFCQCSVQHLGTMLGKFSYKVLIKVSDYPSIKVLTSALFSSSLID